MRLPCGEVEREPALGEGERGPRQPSSARLVPGEVPGEVRGEPVWMFCNLGHRSPGFWPLLGDTQGDAQGE